MRTDLNRLGGEQLSDLVSTLKEAIVAHTEWYNNLLILLSSGTSDKPKEFFDAHAHKHCQFGHWLENTLFTQRISSPILSQLVEMHQTLHEDAKGLLNSRKNASPFSSTEWRQLNILWRQFYVLLLQLFEQVSVYQNQYDALTGLFNRGRAVEILNEEMKRAKRRNTQLALCVCDLDHFKQVNDNYGHAMGDVVLTELSSTMSKQVRAYDVVGRIGGEEFLLFFPDTAPSEANSIIERIREAVANQTFNYKQTKFKVTASFGLVDATHFDAVKSALESADKALYQAKNQGRNRVIMFN